MSRYRQTMAEALKQVYKEQDDKDHEISMARGELEAIADKATQLASALQGKSDEGNPLEAWVQSKITKAKDYINSVSDYMMYNPDMKQNEETILEYTQQQIKQAYGILNDPRYKSGNYDGAVAAIEKLAKGLSKHKDVANALKRANEDNKGRPSPANPTGKDLEEKRLYLMKEYEPSQSYEAERDMKSMIDVIKKAGGKVISSDKPNRQDPQVSIEVETSNSMAIKNAIKKHDSEFQIDENLEENFSKSQIDRLKKEYEVLRGKKISVQNANKLSAMFKNIPDSGLVDLYKADIPFLSVMAMTKMVQKGIPRPSGVKLRMEELDQLDEAEDYGLMGKITPAQLKNIKDVWAKKTKMDITPSVRKMLDRMDIPTKLAIQQAKINVLSDLVKEDVENLGEATSHTVRYTDPLNKKRFAVPFKTHDAAEKKMAQLKKDGVKDIKITMDTLKPGIKFKEGVELVEDIIEGKIKDIFTANQEGESIEKIAKRLSMSVADVKKILGEEKDGVEIAKIRAQRDKEDDKEVASKDKEIESLRDQINILKTKLENEKNKVIKPEPNPDTGEIPLTVGIAHKILKDKREKEIKKENVENPAKMKFEEIAGLKKKAEKTGMPYSILKKVYDRGMAAWKGGHRPGASQQQWAFARVNSFVTKSSGTWGGADKDLAAKVKGSK